MLFVLTFFGLNLENTPGMSSHSSLYQMQYSRLNDGMKIFAWGERGGLVAESSALYFLLSEGYETASDSFTFY